VLPHIMLMDAGCGAALGHAAGAAAG